MTNVNGIPHAFVKRYKTRDMAIIAFRRGLINEQVLRVEFKYEYALVNRSECVV